MTQPQKLRYEWEDDAVKNIMGECRGYKIIGVAVANTKTGEACFVDYSDEFRGVERADYMQDVQGDVDAVYNYSVENMMERKGTKK